MLLLLFVDVCRGLKALVLDTCMGVVTAAMLERMGCQGRIIALYAQSQPSMDAVRTRIRSPKRVGVDGEIERGEGRILRRVDASKH